MSTEAEIREILGKVKVAAAGTILAELNLLREVTVQPDKIAVKVASAGLSEDSRQILRQEIELALKPVLKKQTLEIEYITVPLKDLNRVKKVVAVMSGKGGVGKSLITGLCAVALNRQGYRVGILDADITGSSIPKMFGANQKIIGNEEAILPVQSRGGISLVSTSLLLTNQDDAVIWRGPLISKMINQFWDDVLWGELDYMVVDLPPGTSDAALTVLQALPISGILVVFTPQGLVEMVARKAVSMAKKMEKPIIGLVENMAYLKVPELDKKIEVFGAGHGEELAKSIGVPFIGQMPLDPALAALCDNGDIEKYQHPLLDELEKAISRS
ncbi:MULTISPECIES: Mrp/NBP35 family ATP-binding protein [Dehalococcoides]|jgi:ATPases involved in chromosome partitioning|uniref:Iron-sulfur cluster carrier protein n=2 Tax=root TaxID=1 RepID=A0AB33HN62_9CHLR|nr:MULTISPECIES: Mrp/NBP35 family ATP-binding protein [Dehalococcoides]AQU02598.1 ATP-binding protein [Dehalococcoides mccartyi]AQU03934.1 ATP-binding protein [Dehalococcoides mccartyi]MEA4878651.1 Mrp/NBP35 family ATP-binding protein [Dehalococcoides mccartyi]BAZ96744.1 ATP binding protein [Dehalococcoides mccartyi]